MSKIIFDSNKWKPQHEKLSSDESLSEFLKKHIDIDIDGQISLFDLTTQYNRFCKDHRSEPVETVELIEALMNRLDLSLSKKNKKNYVFYGIRYKE